MATMARFAWTSTMRIGVGVAALAVAAGPLVACGAAPTGEAYVTVDDGATGNVASAALTRASETTTDSLVDSASATSWRREPRHDHVGLGVPSATSARRRSELTLDMSVCSGTGLDRHAPLPGHAPDRRRHRPPT